jgi:hypothetical protein
LIGLINAELIKLAKRRTYWVLVLVLGALVALLAGVFFLLPRVISEDAGFPVVGKPDAYLLGAQQVLGQTWFPLILATMYLAGELATSAWATTLTRNSRRWQHLLARLITTTTASWMAMIMAVAGFSVIALLLAEGTGSLELSEWWAIVWKSLLLQLTWVSLGFAASAWLRSVGPAIGATLAFSFGETLLGLWEGWRELSLSIHTSALLGSLDVGGFGSILGEQPQFSKALAVVLSWTAVSLIAAWGGLQLRDA